METANYQALIVDDDPIARRTVGFALGREQFRCSYAIDGVDAGRQLAEQRFDVVVTDLRMPNKHGHALAVELMQSESRPLIIVHSSIDDPRLAKDLLLRGVDDVVYKPTNYEAFAAKVKSLVIRRQTRKQTASVPEPVPRTTGVSAASRDTLSATQILPAIAIEEYDHRLKAAKSSFPLVPDAYRIFQMSMDPESTLDAIADLVKHYPQFIGEAQKLFVREQAQANDPFTQTEARRLISHVGYKRIGQLALAFNTLIVSRGSDVEWTDARLCLERAIAGRLALDILARKCSRIASKESLMISALVYSLGRLVLGHLFPDEYQQILAVARQQPSNLTELESKVFPVSHTQCLAHLLQFREFPAESCNYIRHVQEDFGKIARLSEPLRSQLELLKLAIFIGEIAVGRWQEGDIIEPPPYRVLRRWRLIKLRDVVDSVRDGLQLWLQTNPQLTRLVGRKQSRVSSVTKPLVNECVEYIPSSAGRSDWLECLAASLGLQLVNPASVGSSPFHGLLIDFLDCDPAQITRTAQLGDAVQRRSMWMISKERESELETSDSCLVFPCSIRTFCDAVERITC